MKRSHWGEFQDDPDKTSETKPDEIILPKQKVEKLKKLKSAALHFEDKVRKIKLKNPLVTQTIEVMNQTEILQSLIDTYANRTGCNNYILSPCQMIPQVVFPPENSANLLINDEKFAKPFWFIPPIQTEFTKGVPRNYPHANQEISRHAIRKSICGLLRIAGFNDASHSSLVMFTDAVDEFIKTFLMQTKDIQINDDSNGICTSDKSIELDVITLEKGYHALTHKSLISVHNYFKNDIIAKNHTEIEEFKEVYQEYDKMMKESQSNIMQKCDDDYMNFLDFTGTMTATNTSSVGGGGITGNATNVIQNATEGGNANLINLIDGDTTNPGCFKDIFEGEIIETPAQDEQMNFSVGPPSLEQ